ncbi:MAG: MogA/MoaB family molybdenum cofactor biosynthesis protein [Nitrospirae bacterium]|nr:MogA/MoaB family molybdenum cofactor biosynthesis protein [Nitrospirota bacterium]MBF0541646.1 MogA/MoaB family molybdenum cofactor biosynthesis protein [Nitrospirota bacterium]
MKIRAAVIILSDKGSKGLRQDGCGSVLSAMLSRIDADVIYYEILPDELDLIKAKLIEVSNIADLIITSGGTGLSPRDVTPDATLAVIDKEIPGISQAIVSEGFKITKRAILSRAVAGVRNNTLIINLPGSPKAVAECLSVILDVLPHAVEKIKGSTEDCSR